MCDDDEFNNIEALQFSLNEAKGQRASVLNDIKTKGRDFDRLKKLISYDEAIAGMHSDLTDALRQCLDAAANDSEKLAALNLYYKKEC